jgi:hypothetical protein
MQFLRSSSSFIAPLVAAFIVGSGCDNAPQAAPTYALHKFTKDELNTSLSAKEKARGAQIAPPPVR